MSHSTRAHNSAQDSSADPGWKSCRVCGASLPTSEFYTRKDSSDGLRSECKCCTKVRARQSVERDPERRRQYMRQYKAENRERLNAFAREPSRRNNRNLYLRKYRANNRSAKVAIERRYRQHNRDKQAARRHARRALPLDSTARTYIAILQDDLCVYCGGKAGTIDHIVPVAKGGTNAWDNLTSACLSCNSRKHDRNLLAFLVGLHHA